MKRRSNSAAAKAGHGLAPCRVAAARCGGPPASRCLARTRIFAATLAILVAGAATAALAQQEPAGESPRAATHGAASGSDTSSLGVGASASDGERSATPEATVERLYRGLVDAASAGDDVEGRYRRLDPIIAATHDLAYIAELTIRRQWESLGPEDKRRFLDAFERLSVMTYASRFGGLKPGMFKVTSGRQVGDDRAEVEATLTTAKGDVIPFQYLLHETDAGWKIINILADNVSDLALKRAEYRDVLEKGSIDDLIRHVEQQADDAARGGQVKYRQ